MPALGELKALVDTLTASMRVCFCCGIQSLRGSAFSSVHDVADSTPLTLVQLQLLSMLHGPHHEKYFI